MTVEDVIDSFDSRRWFVKKGALAGTLVLVSAGLLLSIKFAFEPSIPPTEASPSPLVSTTDEVAVARECRPHTRGNTRGTQQSRPHTASDSCLVPGLAEWYP